MNGRNLHPEHLPCDSRPDTIPKDNLRNSDTLGLGDLINTDKALSVIMAIFVSVAIAFFFGMLKGESL